MPLILESYDADAETVQLEKVKKNLAKDSSSAGTSLVGVVENEKQILFHIKVGSNDQEITDKIVKLWSHAEHRYVPPGKHLPRWGLKPIDSYGLICDGFLELKSPKVYRKKELLSKEGYHIDSAVIKKVIDAAKKEAFATVRLFGIASSYTINKVYESFAVEFNKAD